MTAPNADQGKDPESMAEPFRIEPPTVTVDQDGDQLAVHIAGDLDRSTVDQLQEQLTQVLSDGSTPVVVDLKGVQFCDVAGARLLVATARDHATRGVRLRLKNASDAVRWVFNTVGVGDLLEQPA